MDSRDRPDEASGFEVEERFCEIGFVAGLEETRQSLARRLWRERQGGRSSHVARH
jgi:hypothetical protein